MKTGKTLSELAAEIERQYETKKDYVARTDKVDVLPTETGLAIGLKDKGQFEVGPIAHDQIGSHTGIPKPYYQKMVKEDRRLLANNVETWFQKYPAPQLFRTLDGKNRAFLSDKFNTLDNYDFFAATLPILKQRKLHIMSAEITERRLYLKCVDEQLFRDVPVGFKMGDGSHKIFTTCAPALILSNSEVGFGRLVAETGVYEGGCTNLALFSSGGFKRTHIGARHKLTENLDVEDLDQILSQQAKQKMMEALWLQVRDVIASAFDEKVVAKRAEAFEAAAGREIKRDVNEVMEVFAKTYDVNEAEKKSIFDHLIRGGNFTQYGLHAAITRSAQDVDSYDRATELEYLGGKIVELPRSDWQALAEAA